MHQRQLVAVKLGGAKAIHRQYTEAENNTGGRANHRDHVSAPPASLAESVRSGNEQAAAPRRPSGGNTSTQNKFRTSSGCASVEDRGGQ